MLRDEYIMTQLRNRLPHSSITITEETYEYFQRR